MTRHNRPAHLQYGQPCLAPPTSHREAVPLLTGSSGKHWGTLHDAWQDAADARPGRISAGREPLPYVVLQAVVEHRLFADPVLSEALKHDARLRFRADLLRQHTRDSRGRNWDILDLTVGVEMPVSCRVTFKCCVDAMRDQFDLA